MVKLPRKKLPKPPSKTLKKVTLNAFEKLTPELACDQANHLDSLSKNEKHKLPLAGVPIAIKAENAIAGLPTTYGGSAQKSPSPIDSEIVKRLKDAGALIIGTTRMPEFGQYPYTESPNWGSVGNPVAPGHTTGGSSGGSAAAVAAGIVAAAVGGDGGGSLRIPSAACGLVGLKPQRGRVSVAPETDLWGALGTLGVLTKTTADTALLYDVISGYLETDLWKAKPLSESLTHAYQQVNLRQLRIGIIGKLTNPLVKVDPEVQKVLQKTQQKLQKAGHQVENLGAWPDATPAFLPQFFAALHAEAQRVDSPQYMEKRSRQSVRIGSFISRGKLLKAEAKGKKLALKLANKYRNYDLILSPTIACQLPKQEVLGNCNAITGLIRAMPMVVFTGLANVTGDAAINLPLGCTATGIPIGVQASVFGKDEAHLLRAVAILENSLDLA